MDNSSVDIRGFIHDSYGVENPDTLDRISRAIVMKTVPKGTCLVEMGQRPESLSILREGICRGFLEDAEGKDTTDCFATQPGNVLWGTGRLDEPSVIGVETLTDCDLFQIPMEVILEILEERDMMRVFNRYLSYALECHWTLRMLSQQDAMARYRWFLTRYPGLIDRVNKKYIASFLGMTSVTLSRLRKNLRDDEAEG